MDKNDFRLFKDLDDDMIDEISAKYLDLSDDEIERMFAMIETKDKNQDNTNKENSDEVRGVERYTGHTWYRYAAVAASFVLIAGSMIGTVALLKKDKAAKSNNSNISTSTENSTETSTIKLEVINQQTEIVTAAETTESTTAYAEITTEAETAPATETENTPATEAETTQPAEKVPDEIDKDYIIDLVSNNKNIVSNNKNNINRLYAKVKHTKASNESPNKQSNYSADLIYQYDKNKNCFCQFLKNETGEGYYATDMIIYKNKLLATYRQLNSYHILSELMPVEINNKLRNLLDGQGFYLDGSLDNYLAQKDKWSITGRETVNSRDCVVIEYNDDLYSADSVFYIDIKTGIEIKSITSYYNPGNHTDVYSIITYEITDIKLNDDAPEIVPSDFKQIIKNGGYEPEDEKSKDLSFLDE